MYASALTVLALAASAAAAPTAPPAYQTPEYKWTVSGWSAGATRGSRYYDFNITGPKDTTSPQKPAFLAYCSGSQTDEQGLPGTKTPQPFTPCKVLDQGDEGRSVAAHLLPAASGEGAHIEVNFRWTDQTYPAAQKPYYTATGNATSIFNQFVAPLQTFDIVPSNIVGVL